MKFLTSFIFIFLSFSAFAKLQNSTELQIIAEIQKHKNNDLNFLEKIVNINSGTSNIKGVYAVGKIFKREFEKLGFTTEWANESLQLKRAGTLIAKRYGSCGKHILLIGHLDTVFGKESTFQRFVRNGSFATGPGVIDAKGGDVVILSALSALNKIHALNNSTITVVLTGDEEDSGKPTSLSRKGLIDAARNADVALDFEWALSPNTATIARRGIDSWRIETKGNIKHSSQIFKTAGFGANYELARILEAIRSHFSKETYITVNPEIVLGGTDAQYDSETFHGNVYGKKNAVAKLAFAKGDLRFLTEKQEKQAQKIIFSIVKHNLSGTLADVFFQKGIPAMPPTTRNIALLHTLSGINQELGGTEIKGLNPGLRGAGDISHIAKFVTANLAGLGPVGIGAHSEAETLDIQSLPIATERAALLIYRLTH